MNKINCKIHPVYVFLGMVCLLIGSSASAVTVIENNVRSSANSGGNEAVGGEIKTGNASANSKVETKVSDDDQASVKVDAKAEANGKKVEANVNEENFSGEIDIKKEIQDNGAVAGLEVSIQEANTENQETDAEAPERKNVFEKISDSLSNIFENLREGLKSIFS